MLPTTRDNDAGPALLPAGHPQVSSQRVRRRLKGAMILSAFFHISMVTVFRIVVAFPEYPVDYYSLRIVKDVSAPAEPRRSGGLTLSGGRLDDGLDVELPVLNFAELNRLQIRRALPEDFESLDALSGYRPDDSWSRFAGGLQELGARLRDRLAGQAEPAPERPVLAAAHRPAPGWEGVIIWRDPPEDRELLFTPPLDPLWNIPPDGPSRFEFTLTVDDSGRVTDVWTPDSEPADVLEPLQLKLLQYRFAPITDTAGGIAHSRMGTLILRRTRSEGA
ncbi:MAG TPA: hypothetical protein PLO53_03555 [Candidatus Hydrogenedentes bacterium]|nr:hypothetical protein [Candidatus Hydrogenedentota bacterium]